jgi:hypothetical protein
MSDESYTCPKCGMTSYHPEDIKNKYCGNCHQFLELLQFETFAGRMIFVGQDEGEWPKGTRVKKVNSKSGDTHRDGAPGTIVGALGPVPDNKRAESIIALANKGIEEEVLFIYWVVWDGLPGIPVAITDNRLELLE